MRGREIALECCVYLITGMNGAALSNTASLLASRFDKGVHLRGDIFKRMIVSGREDMTDEPTDEAIRQLFLRFKLAAEVARVIRSAMSLLGINVPERM